MGGFNRRPQGTSTTADATISIPMVLTTTLVQAGEGEKETWDEPCEGDRTATLGQARCKIALLEPRT